MSAEKYIVKTNESNNGKTTVIFSGIYPENDYCLEKLKVDGIAYKYRLYYRTLWSNFDKPELLTFILLNPSTANQYTNDPTINNCIKLAKQSQYDGIEVINIYTERNPVYSKITKLSKTSRFPQVENIEYTDGVKPVLKNIVFAYGCKKFTKIDKQNINKVFELCKNTAENYFIIGIKDSKLITLGYKEQIKHTRHPGNQGWAKLGGFKNAKLKDITNDIYLEKVFKYVQS